MRNLGYIFLREYLERVRSKAFIIITVLTPLLFGAVFGLPILLATRATSVHRIAVADLSGRVRPLLEQRLAERPERGEGFSRRASMTQFRLERAAVEPGREAEARARLSRDIQQGRLDGYLWLGADALEGGRIDYYARNLTDLPALARLQNAVSSAVIQVRLADRGVPSDQVQQLLRSVRLRTVRVSDKGEREDRGAGFLISFFFLMVLYATLILYGVAVMRSVIEEKTSRVFEVLLSSVRPLELMGGKVLGVAAVGLTQYLVWVLLFALAGGGLGTALLTSQMGEFSVPPDTLLFFVVFFLLGFLLYSTMFAALGAAVNTEQESQQLQVVIMPFLVLPMLLATFIMSNPGGPWAVGLSLFPLFSPMLMFLRISVQTPPDWQIALSIVLMLATSLAVLWVSARIYRIGILMYGKRPTLPELWRWVRTG